MIPAGAPKIRPAQRGAASLTFIIVPSPISKPPMVVVAKIAIRPKRTPIINCLSL